MADELNTPNHRYYQNRYNVKIAPNEMSKQWILASGIARIDNAVVLPLFALTEPGTWYDPSDLITLFTDSAGTTPVTAAGQTVGLMLDKSQGLVLGSELRGTGAIGITGVATAATYNTTTGAATCLRVDASNQSFVTFTGLSSAATYVVTVTCVSAVVGMSVRAGSFSAAAATTLTAGQTKTAYVTGTTAITFTDSGGGCSFTVTSIKLLAGNHATQATSTQRPTYQVDSNGKPYLLFDGVDDGMVTGTITAGTNKMQTFLGLRKLNDAATNTFVEFSADSSTNQGSMGFFSRPSGYHMHSAGSLYNTGAEVLSGYATPVTSVITGYSDISVPSATLRTNGTQVSNDTSTQGTGNFLAYPLYIGRRGGASLPFNGRLYSLIIRFGPNLTTGQITSAESWVNAKTGAY
jgi:hypothetical protein